MKTLIAMLACAVMPATAQPLELDMNVFAQRRQIFINHMQPGSVAIFPSKPEYLRNLDVEYEYRQESNFYYLSGFEEPESILFITPDEPRYKYVLFVRKRDPRRETYEGPRAGVEGAMATFKSDTAYFYDDFKRSMDPLPNYDRTLYYTFGINPEADKLVTEMFIQRRSGCNCSIIDPSPIVAEMRLIKNEDDLRMGLKKAIDISAQAHIDALRSIKSGMYEYEVQAVFESVYRKNGSPRNAYPCIIGSGPNSTILHYNKNTRQLNDGDLILMDCAAEYGCYAADITRTVPVNGTFTKRQREIYQLVLDAQTAAMNMVKPGLTKSTLDTVINDVLGNGLVRLGFIKEKKDFAIFSLHGYSHWIGLEVHDVGAYSINGVSRKLQPGMTFTIEPGIYVRPDVFDKMKQAGYSDEAITVFRRNVQPYMDIGIRIEDDILVTETGHKNLSAAAPRDIEAIEAAMKSTTKR